MVKRTLIEMVQSIMSDMDSDEVTSITDTVESAQVASTIRDVYEQFISNEIVPEIQQVRQPLVDATNKVFVQIPDDVKEVLSIKIKDVDGNWSNPKFLAPMTFLDDQLKYDTTASNVEMVADPVTTVSVPVYKDQTPKYWTSFDDAYVVFNSYDATIDITGLQLANILLYVSYYPEWETEDDFIIPVDENIYPYLLAEAKSTCFVNLKQQANSKVEQQARKQRVKIQHGKFRTSKAEEASLSTAQPNFGRGTAR